MTRAATSSIARIQVSEGPSMHLAMLQTDWICRALRRHDATYPPWLWITVESCPETGLAARFQEMQKAGREQRRKRERVLTRC